MTFTNAVYVAIAISCSLMSKLVISAPTASATGIITVAGFGQLSDGTAIQQYTLRNHRGMQAKIATYGGTITYLTAPDRHGKYADVVLGFEALSEYLKASPYFGALIGRYGTHKSLDASRYLQVTR